MQDRDFGEAALGLLSHFLWFRCQCIFFFFNPRREKATKNNRLLFQNSTGTGQRDYHPFQSADTHYTPPFFNFSAIHFFCS